MRKIILPIIAAASLALGGCAASIAAGVAGAAIRSAGGDKDAAPTEDPAPLAAAACRAEASRHGQVSIIDVERRGGGKIIVWGTAESGRKRQSFECRYDGKIAGFKLRQIQPRQ